MEKMHGLIEFWDHCLGGRGELGHMASGEHFFVKSVARIRLVFFG